MHSDKKVKVKMVRSAQLCGLPNYRITELVNCASITTCEKAKQFHVGDSATELEAEEIARDRRWDCQILEAK